MKLRENKRNLIIRILKFLLTIFLAYISYKALFSTILTEKYHIFGYLLIWFLISYLVLPYLNRLLSKLYIPDYFIGRTKTSDGLLGDPINLAFYGNEEDIIKAFESSGWNVAEDLNFISSIKIGLACILSKSYSTAPVSSLYLFSRKQDIAFEREIKGNPRKRHHIRLWKTPANWNLPGGSQADWLGSATFDKNVGLSLFTGQITHKIDANVDEERDFVIHSLESKDTIQDYKLVEHFTSSYHSRNGGGDRIKTDGALPFITIKKVTTLL
ncbi:MAG: LssY C-terminal domain-containing protein [Clostridium sp.]|uniref:LssY C-terminal domain-containing protein n=1 Tax=Clostridium sp. TaxID=1506 RepID=UPI003F3FE522